MAFLVKISKLCHIIQWPLCFVSLFSILGITLIGEGALGPALWTVALFGILILLTKVLVLKENGTSADALNIGIVGYSLALCATGLIYIYYLSIYSSPYESGGTDDFYFEEKALLLADHMPMKYSEAQELIKSAGSGTWHHNENYAIFVGLLHWASRTLGFNEHTLNPRIFNCFILALTGVIAWCLARRVCASPHAAHFAGLFTVSLPATLFNAAHVYRDTLVAFGCTATVYFVVKTFEEINRGGAESKSAIRPIVFASWAILNLLVAGVLRDGLYLILGFIIFLMFVLQVRNTMSKILAVIGGILCGVLIDVITGGNLNDKIVTFFTTYTELRSDVGDQKGIATAIWKLQPILSIPLRLVYGLIAPLPFIVDIHSDTFRNLGTLFWYVLLPFLFYGIRDAVKGFNPKLITPVIAFLCLYIPVVTITMQARHISMYLSFAAVIIASQLELRRTVMPEISAMGGLGIIGAFAYLIYRVN